MSTPTSRSGKAMVNERLRMVWRVTRNGALESQQSIQRNHNRRHRERCVLGRDWAGEKDAQVLGKGAHKDLNWLRTDCWTVSGLLQKKVLRWKY